MVVTILLGWINWVFSLYVSILKEYIVFFFAAAVAAAVAAAGKLFKCVSIV